MAKKFLLVFAFLAAFSILVFGFAFADKSAVPKSELLKPIDLAPEDYVSQYLLKPVRGYVPSLAPTANDAVVGTSWYDQQHNAAMPKMIANDYQSGDKGQHFTWMRWPSAPPANRYVDYRYNDALGSWKNKVVVDGGAFNAGYCGLDVFLNSYAAVIYHTTARQYPDPTEHIRRAKIAIDKGLTPGAGTFWVYDIPDSTETMGEAGMWPHGEIDACGNIHVISMEGKTAAGWSPLGYIRCTPQGDLLKCEGPGVGPYYVTAGEMYDPDSNMISYLDHTGSIAYIVVADPNSQKVALAWTKWTPYPDPEETTLYQTAQDVWYLESTNCGNDWILADTFADFTFTNITEWEPGEPYRTYADIAGTYDVVGDLHLFWNAHYLKEATDEYDAYDVSLMHWSPNVEQVCPGGYEVKYSVVSAVKNEPTEIGLWGWNRTLGKMSAGVGIPGSAKAGWLFLVWQQLAEKPDMSLTERSNGEIYFAFSTNRGVSWSAPRNLTNTPSPDCAAGDCESEGWPSLATRVDSFAHIQYVLDRDAGICVQEEGTETENYVMYNRYRVDTLVAVALPRADWSPKGDLVKPWLQVPNDGAKICTLSITNIGTATLTGNLSEDADWFSLSPTSFSMLEGPCPSFIEVDIDAYGYSDTFLCDTITVTTNDINFDVRVNVVVADEYWSPEWVTIDNGVFVLDHSNVGNFGHQKEKKGFYVKADSFAAIYDASMICGINHTTYGKKVARWIFDSRYILGESAPVVDTFPGVKTIRFSSQYAPLNPLPPDDWYWWFPTFWYEWWLSFIVSTPRSIGFIEIIHFDIFWNDFPIWWSGTQSETTNPDMYVGMAIDFDLPSDTGNVLNTPGYDEVLNLIYVQGLGDSVTAAGNRLDSLYTGIAFVPNLENTFDDIYGGHILPNDIYVYPDAGYRDDSLYNVMSTPEFSVRDPEGPRTVDQNCVMTFAHVPAGYLDLNEVEVTIVIAVSTGGLDDLKNMIRMIKCGNANEDINAAVNLADVITIANYLIKGGDEPWLYMSDVNGDCAVNLGDVVYLANYLIKAGPDLHCDCAELD